MNITSTYLSVMLSLMCVCLALFFLGFGNGESMDSPFIKEGMVMAQNSHASARDQGTTNRRM